MAARYSNNPRVTNTGDVEQYYCLDVRRLVEEGVLVKGAQSQTMGIFDRPFGIYADLRQPDQAFIDVRYFDSPQRIRLTWAKDRLNRSRVFFVDDTGRKIEKIYLVNGRFVSRHVGKLTFRSQSRGRTDQLLALRKPLQAELARDEIDRHLNDMQRTKLDARLQALQDRLDEIGFAMVYDWEDAKQRRKERRQSSRERVRAVDLAMNQRASVSPEWILNNYTSLVEQLKFTTGKFIPPKPPEWPVASIFNFDFLLPSVDKSKWCAAAEIDLDDLRRLKMLRAGEIHAREIGWPIKRLPQRRRKIYLILDLRDPERPCATIVFHTPRRVRTQFFWLYKYPGMFGREAYGFECPMTGEKGGRLVYGDKKFHVGWIGQRRLPRSHSVYELARQTRPGQPPSPERIAFLKKLLAEEGRLPVMRLMLARARQRIPDHQDWN